MHVKPWHAVTFLILASAALTALELPAGTRIGMPAASLASGAASLSLMAAAAVLGARWKFVESVFGGLDRVYVVHKWLGIWALGLASFHLVFKAGMSGWESIVMLPLPDGWPRFLRQFSFVGLMLIVLLALNRNIPYSVWRWWHKLSGPLFVVVVLHWLSFKQPIHLDSPAGIWLASLSTAGVAGAFYKLLLYPLLSGHAEYQVVGVRPGAAAMHLELEPTRKGIDFQPGQFGFLRLNVEGMREPHPFTIASGSGGKGRVCFEIRSLGDFTGRMIATASVGMRADIYAPYGRFLRRQDARREVWIGGGVGISPFIAWLQDPHAGSFDKVTLFYFHTSGRDFPEVPVMASMARERGVELVPVAGGPSDPAFVDRIGGICRETAPAEIDVAFCGPRGLLAQVSRTLQANGVPGTNLRHEFFEFR